MLTARAENQRKGRTIPATTNRKVRKKRVDISQLLYVILLTTAFATAIVWASVTLFQYVRSQVRPSDEIVVGTFTTVGQGQPTDTKAVATILASKLERLKRLAGREPSGFGLVQTPILTSVPDQVSERQSDIRTRLQGLNLKVKDVDVNAMVDAIRSIFAPARPVLEGQVIDIGDRLEIRAELLWKGNTIGGWVASRTKPPQDPDQNTLNELYDDLLFQITFDIPRNPKLHWWAEGKGDDGVPNWQTLEALTLGLQSLQTYEQSLEYTDLQRSIKYLERIPINAPGYTLGHYFLAVALGEDRQEDRAASVLSQVEQMQPSKMLKWSATFQRAAAMLRRYKRPFAEEAAKAVLGPLINELRSVSDGKIQSSAEEMMFASRLLPMAYAQLAYTYGTLFTLKSSLPDADLRKSSEAASAQAWNAFKNPKLSWSSERERKEAERWLYNTQGYSKFRIAQAERKDALSAGKSSQEADTTFRAACEGALVDLRQANEILPNNYEVLQNEAMILDDQDYDPQGTQLGEAETLYDRTKLFVPRDYYQYERLALIYWRRLKSHPPMSIQQTLIDRGQKAVSSAALYRQPEQSPTAAILAAYFSACAAMIETDTGKKREDIHATVDQAQNALDLKIRSDIAHDVAELMNEMAGKLPGTDQEEKTLKQRVLEVAMKLKAL